MTNYDDPMANSATLRLAVTQGVQNVAANTTVLNWSLTLLCTNGVSNTGLAKPYSVTINGVTYSGTFTFDFRSSTSKLIVTGSTTVTHDANGTKNVTVSASVDASPVSIGAGAVSGTFTPTPIARASNATLSAAAFDAGTAVTINTNRADPSFTHTIEYTFGSLTGVIGTGVGASTTWTPPLSLLTMIPNAVSGNGVITTKTYSGATLIGTTNVAFTLQAPATAVPTIGSITASEAVSAVSSGVGAFVQLASRLNLAIVGAAGVQGSTITAYRITAAGYTINAASGTTGVIGVSGTVTITATVTDSRNRTGTLTLNVTVLPYAPPAIAAATLTTRRSLGDGTLDDNGTYIKVNFTASVQSLLNGTQRNSLTYRISTRAYGDTVWSLVDSVTLAAGDISEAVERVIGADGGDPLVGAYPIDSSWDVLVEVVDIFATSTIMSTVATATIFMHWDGSVGLGLGKYHESGMLDVDGDIYQGGLKVVDVGDVATTAVAGLVELATTTEASAGTDSSRATTPQGVEAWGNARGATTTKTGLVELATQAEADAGTDPGRVITPATLNGVISPRQRHRSVYGAFTTSTYDAGIGNSGQVWWGEKTVSFGFTFDQIPTISVYCFTTGAVVACTVVAASTTGFTFRAIRFQAAISGTFSYGWSATGRVSS